MRYDFSCSSTRKLFCVYHAPRRTEAIPNECLSSSSTTQQYCISITSSQSLSVTHTHTNMKWWIAFIVQGFCCRKFSIDPIPSIISSFCMIFLSPSEVSPVCIPYIYLTHYLSHSLSIVAKHLFNFIPLNKATFWWHWDCN